MGPLGAKLIEVAVSGFGDRLASDLLDSASKSEKAGTRAQELSKGFGKNLGLGFMSQYGGGGAAPSQAGPGFMDQMGYGIGSGAFQNGNAAASYGIGMSSPMPYQVDTSQMLDPQMVFGMMNNLQYQPLPPGRIQAQFSYVPMTRRGLL